MKVLASVRRLLARRKPAEPPITLTSEGFSCEGSEVRWSEIVQVRALKLDLLTWDEVRFVFGLSSGGAFEVSEEQPGFEALMSAVVAHFPSVADWQDQIIKPAFARNETVLYQK
jgi:hypothetical protein